MSDHEINHHIDRFKESFLFAAARGGRIEECASLISFGANVDWRENGKEDNPLLAAVRNSMQDVAALLLAHGANPTVRDRDGNTVMHLAAANGDEGMASLFSPNASDLSLSTNKHGMTAIDIAVQRGYNSFAELLNNLLFGSDDEKNARSASVLTNDYNQQPIHLDNEVNDDENDSENSLADSNLSMSTRTGDSENRHSIYEETVDDAVNDLRGELYQAKFALNELMKENEMLKGKLAVYCEDNIESFLTKKSLVELNSIEEQVRRSLDKIIKAKEVASSNLEDARVCVICKENPKSVLFLNCRHLCVCNECGHLEILVHCPLCRMEIREKINVYA